MSSGDDLLLAVCYAIAKDLPKQEKTFYLDIMKSVISRYEECAECQNQKQIVLLMKKVTSQVQNMRYVMHLIS